MNKRKKLIVAGIVLFVVLVATIMAVIATTLTLGTANYMEQAIEKEKDGLQNALMEETWVTYSEDLGSKLYFEFSEDYVKYSGEFLGSSKRKIANMEYSVCDGESIYVNGHVVQIEVDDGCVIFTPSFVDGREYLICEAE